MENKKKIERRKRRRRVQRPRVITNEEWNANQTENRKFFILSFRFAFHSVRSCILFYVDFNSMIPTRFLSIFLFFFLLFCFASRIRFINFQIVSKFEFEFDLWLEFGNFFLSCLLLSHSIFGWRMSLVDWSKHTDETLNIAKPKIHLILPAKRKFASDINKIKLSLKLNSIKYNLCSKCGSAIIRMLRPK